MKKQILKGLLLAALVLPTAVSAQVIFSEDFDGIPGSTAGGAGTYTFPAGWLLRNVDNGTPAAAVSYVNEAWERREDFANAVTDSAAFSTSWNTPVVTCNDWMWTPLIGPLPANCVLKWNAVTYDPSYPDGYEVRIMTSAQGPPTGGTGVIGNQITNSTSLFSITAENTTWTARQVSLNAYAGQSVYIAFRNTSTDKFLLLVDDVQVEVQVNVDAEVTVVDTISEYTIVPMAHVTALGLNGTVRNNGLNAINGQVTVNVYETATNVYTATSAPFTGLATNATSNYSVTGYTPTATGFYYSENIAVVTNGTDQVPSNDTLYSFSALLVDDSTYARDDGNVTGALGIGAGNGGYLGNAYELLVPDTMTSVGIYVTGANAGEPLSIAIWDMVSGVPNAIVAVTDTILYPDDSARYYVLPIHGLPAILPAGMYAVTAVEYDSILQVGTATSIHTLGTTWVNWPTNPMGGWANNEDFGFNISYVIRPHFGNIVCNLAVAADSVNASCGTCPDGSANSSVSGGYGNVSYLWSTGDTSATISNVLPGTYTVTVTDAMGCSSTATTTVDFSNSANNLPGLVNAEVYPNPNNGIFALSMQFETATDVQLEMYNTLGEKVYTSNQPNVTNARVNLETKLAKGVYSLVIRTKDGVKTMPVTIQ
jgi:hypothetical protein